MTVVLVSVDRVFDLQERVVGRLPHFYRFVRGASRHSFAHLEAADGVHRLRV